MKWLMKYSGSAEGKSGRRYYFNTGQEMDAANDEFSEEIAEKAPDVVEEKPEKKETRGRKPKNQKSDD